MLSPWTTRLRRGICWCDVYPHKLFVGSLHSITLAMLGALCRCRCSRTARMLTLMQSGCLSLCRGCLRGWSQTEQGSSCDLLREPNTCISSKKEHASLSVASGLRAVNLFLAVVELCVS